MGKRIFTLIVFSIGLFTSMAQDVEIQFMANSGIWLKSAEKQLLIDVIFDKEFEFLDALPDSELKLLENAKPEYHKIDLILATHLHADHFHPVLTGNHLKANPKTEFFAPAETVADFQQGYQDFELISKRVYSDSLKLYEAATYNLSDIEIEAIRVEHFGSDPWNKAENYAYLVHFGGMRILHVGDSRLTQENLSKFNLEEKNIDVAILPYWQIGSEEQLSLIEEKIGAKHLLIVHIPVEDFPHAQKTINEIGYKNAKAMTKQLEVIVLD